MHSLSTPLERHSVGRCELNRPPDIFLALNIFNRGGGGEGETIARPTALAPTTLISRCRKWSLKFVTIDTISNNVVTHIAVKAHANRPNIVGQQQPNIVGPNNVVTCCVRLHGITTLLALVEYSLKPVKL